MRVLRFALSATVALAALMVTASPASAQGCILLRQTSPMFGTTGSVDQEVGTWNLTFTGRNSTADDHWNGTVEQVQRKTDGTYVVNRQNSATMSIGYQWTPRLSVNVGVPFVEAAWGIPSPRTGGPAARANENARGLGDITSLARFSLFNPGKSTRTWNLQFGGGVKFPTGNDSATDVFPDGNGNNDLERHVDISVLPGDGGWGLIMDLQGYKGMGRFLTFGSGTWLMNPKNTGAPTRNTLITATPTNFNTVSDQFIFRAGTSVTVTKHIAASVAWRMEGVPRYDLIGLSEGFRRPGVTMYVEPGVTLTTGRHSVSFNIPIAYYRNRFPNPYTNSAGDSTFPTTVAIATYSTRLGKAASMNHGITDQPPRPALPSPGDGTQSELQQDQQGSQQAEQSGPQASQQAGTRPVQQQSAQQNQQK